MLSEDDIEPQDFAEWSFLALKDGGPEGLREFAEEFIYLLMVNQADIQDAAKKLKATGFPKAAKILLELMPTAPEETPRIVGLPYFDEGLNAVHRRCSLITAYLSGELSMLDILFLERNHPDYLAEIREACAPNGNQRLREWGLSHLIPAWQSFLLRGETRGEA